jgi:hypothetical protein
MNSLKRPVIAAVAALGLLAAGADVAAGETTLCKTTTEPCTSPYGVGTIIKGSSSRVTLINEFITDTCKKATLEAKVETSTTPKGKLASATWSECTYPTTTATNGELQIHHDAGEGGLHNGKVTVVGVVWKIEGPATCYFGGTITEGITLKAGEHPVLVANAKVKLVNTTPHISSGLCPAEGVWTGEYAISPSPLYVTTGV